MNKEIFFGIAVFLLVWEVVYILWMKYNKKYNKKYKNVDYLDKPTFIFESNEWYLTKLLSFLPAATFFLIQIIIIDGKNYINLLWEFLIIIAIVMLFYANKLIAKLINSETKK